MTSNAGRDHFDSNGTTNKDHKMTTREKATILAALRYWQEQDRPQRPGQFEEIATNCGQFRQMEAHEIDALAERLNFPPDNSAERQTNPAAWALRQIDRLSGLDNYSRQEICLCLGEIRRICRDIIPEIEAGAPGSEEAMQACAQLASAYQAGEDNGGSVDWSAIDEAHELALAALKAAGTPMPEPETAE